MTDALLDTVAFRCTLCDAEQGACDCWTRYTARLVEVEGGWEARLERADGQRPIVWPYKRRHAAQGRSMESEGVLSRRRPG